MNVAATCDTNTIVVSIPTALVLNGMRLASKSGAAPAVTPRRYQRGGAGVRSATGRHRRRQMLDEMPIATIDADNATGKPARVRTNGRVTVANPPLMPYGRTRKKMVRGEVERPLRAPSSPG